MAVGPYAVGMSSGAAAQQPPRRSAAAAQTPRSGASTDDRALDRDAAERVLRRAVRLDEVSGADAAHRVSVRALLDAADELGIDRAEVRRAVVEEELGLLEEHPRRSDALLGPERFVVARVLDGDVDDVSERIDLWMRRGRVLRRSRSPLGADGEPGWVEYSRRNDPMAGAQRAWHAAQGSERLAHVRRVRVVVSRLDDRRVVVGLLVDATRSRHNAAAAGAATAVAGTAASAVAAAATSPFWLAVGAVASASAGLGVMWSRKAWTDGVEDELESLLDAVESGQRPPSVIDGVTTRLVRAPRPTRP